MKFDCDRTCPLHERVDACRFNAIFAKLGAGVVTSHTVKVKCQFADPDTFGNAAIAMGGKVLGNGTHNLYSGQTATGFGITLPNWSYPIVLANGELSYDNFGGSWGNPADLERLKGEYIIATAESAAQSQGWLTERQGENLIVHHPNGGSMTVNANGAEANGFQGVGCHDALSTLLGPMATEWTAKPEAGQVACEVVQTVQ